MALFVSCSKSFLDQVPQGSTADNVFYNEKGIGALLTGTYAMVPGSALWTISWGASITNWTYGSVGGGDAYKGSTKTDQIPINEIEQWQVSTTNNYPAEKWRLCIGMGVNRANTVLKVISGTTGLADATKTEFVAETRFLRGLFYFESWLVFGDKIPLIDETKIDVANTISNVNAPGAVLAFIVADLQYAADNLPATQAQPGRPTKYAAMALEARAYLQVLDYTSAEPLLDAIIASGQYHLMPKFHDNYAVATNNNAESIFEIQRSVNDYNESLNAEAGIGLNAPQGGDIGTCCGFHCPSQNLANAFKVDANGLPLFDTYNTTDLKNDHGVPSSAVFTPATDLLDPRIDWTMGRRGIPYLDWGIMRGADWIRDQTWGGPYLPSEKTFFNKVDRNTMSTTTGWQTGIDANNIRYIRYAHVLLWKAECLANKGDGASLTAAVGLVNQIRTRAGNQVVMGKVNITQLPPSVYPWGAPGDVDFTQPAANYKIGTYTSFASAADAMRAVQWETRLEFGTEGMRFFDLRRWDIANPGSMKATLDAYAAADIRVRSEPLAGATFSDKAKYMPVPQTQIDLEPGVLVQNTGY